MNKIEHGYCPICHSASVGYVEVYNALFCVYCDTAYLDIDEYNADVDAKRDSIGYAMWELGQRRRDLFNLIWDKVDPILAYLIGKLADGINKLSSWIRKMENDND